MKKKDNVSNDLDISNFAENFIIEHGVPAALRLVSRFGKKLLMYWLTLHEDTNALNLHDDGNASPPFLVVGLGRCGCHVSAELSEIISSRKPQSSTQSDKKGLLKMFLGGNSRNPPLLFKPIMLIGDIDETSFDDFDGLLNEGGVAEDVKGNYLRLNFHPIGEGGVGHVPIFAEFLSKALLLLPEFGVADGQTWSDARFFLKSFASTSNRIPRLVFYIFSSGGGTGAGSATEIMRAQNYAKSISRTEREYYFSGITILPRNITVDQRQLINTGRTIVQYLANLNIKLDSSLAYDEAPSCNGSAFIGLEKNLTLKENNISKLENKNIMPWNGLALISNDIMSASTNDPLNVEKVESNTNQYIAQQIFNLAAAQFPAGRFERKEDEGSPSIEKKNYQAIRLDPNDLKTGLLGPYGIAFSAADVLENQQNQTVDQLFLRSIDLPANRTVGGKDPVNIIEGISVCPVKKEKYQAILGSLKEKMSSDGRKTRLMESDFENIRGIPFFAKCPRLIYSMTIPQEKDFPASAQNRLEDLITWCFPSLIQKRAAITRGTTAFFSLSIYIETSVLLSLDVRNAIVNYLHLCWTQRHTNHKQFIKRYNKFLKQHPPISDHNVEKWLGKTEQYGKNIPNFDSLCANYNAAWLSYIQKLPLSSTLTDKAKERLVEHKVEDSFLNANEVAAAIRYLNYAEHVTKIATIEIDNEVLSEDN